MLCVKAKKQDAEKVKQDLIARKVLAKGYRPDTDKDYIYFPIKENIDIYKTEDREVQPTNKIKIDLSSYDQVGDIVIVHEEVSKESAEKLLQHKNVKVVLRKKGIHQGEFRTQDLEFLAGEKRKETIYKENGITMKVNVENSYFSPRLSTERKRIAELVKDNEKVLVLFSGIAPYPLVIAKLANPQLIVAVEKNPKAHKYALENCKKYKNIELHNLDAKDFTHKERFDRIIMPLPMKASDYLTLAASLLKKGGIIHMYDFTKEEDIPESSTKKVKEKLVNAKILNITKCGQYSPGRYRICVDIEI